MEFFHWPGGMKPGEDTERDRILTYEGYTNEIDAASSLFLILIHTSDSVVYYKWLVTTNSDEKILKH